MIDKIEDSLNGGYGGLYGEVVTEDTYRLKELKFVPDVIIDLGGNVGCFSRFARTLFPDARIVTVEPNPDNCEVFKKFTEDNNLTLLEAAVGIGQIWRCEGAVNGAHEVYLSSGLGYPFNVGEKMETILEVEVPTIMPDEIVNKYVKEGEKFIVKVDVEGNENIIFTHEPSMEALRKADYVTMEIHWNALNGSLLAEVKNKTLAALKSFDKTHDCELKHIMFYATKK